MIKDWFSKISDAYTKDPNSNLGKLLSVLDDEIIQLKNTFSRVEDWRNLNNAQGKTLDLIGNNIGQKRGKANDEVYRSLIKSKIARDRSDGTFNKVIEVLAQTLNCDAKEFQLHSSSKPASVYMTNAPIKTIYASGLTPYTFTNIVQSALSAGVQVEFVQLNGTFELSSIHDGLSSVETPTMGATLNDSFTLQAESDLNNLGVGLSSVTNPTIGGDLGAYIIPDKEVSAPL